MRKTKFYTSCLLIVFLMFCILPAHYLDANHTDNYDLNLNADYDTDSWSRIIKLGRRLYNPSIELIGNNSYVIGNLGEIYTEFDVYLAKFNSSGVKLWEHAWGGPEFNHIKDYVFDSENNLYILGLNTNYYLPYSGSIFMLKYNSTGNLLWSITIDPSGSNYYEIFSIQIDLNDSIYISSLTTTYPNSTLCITKLSTSGNITWSEEIEMNYQYFDFYSLNMQIDSVGNVYLFGDGYSFNLLLLKLNSSGSIQWSYEWGELEFGSHLKLDVDGNVIAIGISCTEYSNYDIWIMKINSSGNQTKKVIIKSFGAYGVGLPNYEVQFLDNIFVLTEYFLYEYNYSLDSKWKFHIEHFLQIYEIQGFNLVINSQNEMYFFYYTHGDIAILKFNSSGLLLSDFNWGGSYNDILHSVRIDSQDNLYMLCTIEYADIWKDISLLSILVKNPKCDGKPPHIDHQVDDRDIFVFSLLSVMCFVSVILVFNTLKPVFKKLR